MIDNDLISREALKKYARIVFDKDLGKLRVVDVSDIDNAPTVEAYTPEQVKELVDLNKKLSEERPQGEWLKAINEFFNWECSLCHKPHDFKDNYCPNCGAKLTGSEKMNGGTENENHD